MAALTIAERLAELDWAAMERSLWDWGYAKTEFREHHVSRIEFGEFRTAVLAEFAELRCEVAANGETTRRHFDVVAESLRAIIQLVAEGVLTVDHKLERFAAEVRDEFHRVDRRFLKIEVHLGVAPDGSAS
jgi:hypothetical protein